MADVYRVTANWTGFVGAPGTSKFTYQGLVDDASVNAATGAVRAFFFQLANLLHTGWTIQVLPTVEVFNDVSGLLTAEVVGSVNPNPVAGTAATTQVYAGGAGARVEWRTPGIFNGRRVHGRTYLVPLVGVQDVDGTLNPAVITGIQNAANQLIAAIPQGLQVWAKKWSGGNPNVQLDGRMFPVDAAIVPDRTGILKSRRD